MVKVPASSEILVLPRHSLPGLGDWSRLAVEAAPAPPRIMMGDLGHNWRIGGDSPSNYRQIIIDTVQPGHQQDQVFQALSVLLGIAMRELLQVSIP